MTPVEAMQREIERMRLVIDDDSIDINPQIMHIAIAALELAKADAELHEHRQKDITKGWNDWMRKKFHLECLVAKKRGELYEALQK